MPLITPTYRPGDRIQLFGRSFRVLDVKSDRNKDTLTLRPWMWHDYLAVALWRIQRIFRFCFRGAIK